MTDKKRDKEKQEEQEPNEDEFGLDMDFSEALERFLKVTPNESKTDGMSKNAGLKRTRRR